MPFASSPTVQIRSGLNCLHPRNTSCRLWNATGLGGHASQKGTVPCTGYPVLTRRHQQTWVPVACLTVQGDYVEKWL
jgi:hypothetical protein